MKNFFYFSDKFISLKTTNPFPFISVNVKFDFVMFILISIQTPNFPLLSSSASPLPLSSSPSVHSKTNSARSSRRGSTGSSSNSCHQGKRRARKLTSRCPSDETEESCTNNSATEGYLLLNSQEHVGKGSSMNNVLSTFQTPLPTRKHMIVDYSNGQSVNTSILQKYHEPRLTMSSHLPPPPPNNHNHSHSHNHNAF